VKHVVIFNPAARSGRAARHREAVEQVLATRDLDVEVQESERSAHAVEMAERAASRAGAVAAAGGDGTVQEVARGLLRAREEAALGVLPLGTGNDFAKAAGIPTNWRDAARALASSETAMLDVGRVRWRGDERGERCFVNAVGVGFDAQVARAARSATRLRGTAAYLAGVLRTLRRWEGPEATVRAGKRGAVLHDGPLFLVTLGNGICSGGGFYLTPTASPDDGALDLCLIEDLSVARVGQIIPLVFRGRHAPEPEVTMHRVRSARIESEAGLPIHADGEVLAERARCIEVETLPGRLPVRRPLTTPT